MIRMNLQLFGGRGGGSGMSGGGGGASEAVGVGGSFISNQKNMEDYAVAVGMFDRDFLRTADGQEALRDFMDGEREAGLTEQDMRQAIRSTGSNSSRSNSSRSTGGTYKVSDVPSRIQSFTSTGTGVSGNWESKTYVTSKGDAIKETTKYDNGRKTTSTVMRNYPQNQRTREQFESELAKMAKAQIRTGGKVTAIDNKKKGR